MKTLPFGSGYYIAQTGTWAAFILPYMEQKPLYELFDFDYAMSDPVNANAVQTVVPTFICPSDPKASEPILQDRACATAGMNPNPSLGLWYPGSMGPTHDDYCLDCEDPKSGPNDNDSYCCQGWNFGTRDPADNSVGMFGRYPGRIRFEDCIDGTSNTLMCGETLPGECCYNGAFVPNFPIAGTTIRINKREVCPQPPQCYREACGFKSLHSGGVHFLLGDASVHFVSEFVDYRVINELGTRAGDEVVTIP